jgi:hypothetical protein
MFSAISTADYIATVRRPEREGTKVQKWPCILLHIPNAKEEILLLRIKKIDVTDR